MNNTYTKLNTNPFLAFLQEQAQAKGISIDDFCKPIGYTPRMLEALAEYSWLQPSNQTLAVLADELGTSLDSIEKQLRTHKETDIFRDSIGRMGEIVSLYELMQPAARRLVTQEFRRRGERHFNSLERGPRKVYEVDDAANKAEIEQIYAGLTPRLKTEVVQLLRRINIHYLQIAKRDKECLLGMPDRISLEMIL
jgi:hypothetical protein